MKKFHQVHIFNIAYMQTWTHELHNGNMTNHKNWKAYHKYISVSNTRLIYDRKPGKTYNKTNK